MRTKVNNRLGLDLRAAQFSEQIRRTVPQLNFPPNFNCNGYSFARRLLACSRLLDSGETRKWKASEKLAVRGKVSSRFIFAFALSWFGVHSVSNPGTGYNLGQNKMEQQTPIPLKSRMKPRAGWGQKRAIFPSLIWGGGGGSRFSIYLVQDCRRRLVACELDADSLLAGKLLIKLNLAYILLLLFMNFLAFLF